MSKNSLTIHVLASTDAPKPVPKAALAVRNNKRLIRQAMRRGWKPSVIAETLDVSLRSLQKYMREEGMFFRKPRSAVSQRRLARVTRNKKAHLGVPGRANKRQ